MFELTDIPSNVQITTLLDGINPDDISGVFHTDGEEKQDIDDEDYRKARACFGRTDEFFNEMRVLMRRNVFESWQHFIVFIYDDLDFDWNAIVVHTPRLGMYAVPRKNV